MNVYSNLDEITTKSYSVLKKSLLHAFRLTDDHYRKFFRSTRIQPDSTFQHFTIDLSRKFDLWLNSANVDRDFDSLRDYMLVDQFMAAIPPEVCTFVREHKVAKLNDIGLLADNYASAHSGSYPSTKKKPVNSPLTETNHSSKPLNSNTKISYDKNIKCFSYGLLGHRKSVCPRNPVSSVHRVTCDLDNQDVLGPMYCGTVNGSRVSTILRDTGCTCVVVSDNVLPDADLSDAKFCDVSDFIGRTNKFPIVRCFIKCDLYEGWIDAVRAPLKYCAVLLGNVPGIKPSCNLPRQLDEFIENPDMSNILPTANTSGHQIVPM